MKQLKFTVVLALSGCVFCLANNQNTNSPPSPDKNEKVLKAPSESNDPIKPLESKQVTDVNTQEEASGIRQVSGQPRGTQGSSVDHSLNHEKTAQVQNQLPNTPTVQASVTDSNSQKQEGGPTVKSESHSPLSIVEKPSDSAGQAHQPPPISFNPEIPNPTATDSQTPPPQATNPQQPANIPGRHVPPPPPSDPNRSIHPPPNKEPPPQPNNPNRSLQPPTNKNPQPPPNDQKRDPQPSGNPSSVPNPAQIQTSSTESKSAAGETTTSSQPELESDSTADKASNTAGDTPDFYEASKVNPSLVESLEVTSRSTAKNGDITKLYSVTYKPEKSGRVRSDIWQQRYISQTNSWAISKLSSRYSKPVTTTGSVPASTPASSTPAASPVNTDGLISPDFTRPPSSAGGDTEPSKPEPTDLTPEQIQAQQMYEEGESLLATGIFSNHRRAFQLLSSAAYFNHTKARRRVAFAHLFGDYLPQNFTLAQQMLEQLSSEGDPKGQLGLGIMYATGLHVNSSQAKALIYFTFSALGGEELAQMIMGYRYLSGIGVQASCETALLYYSKVAHKVASEVTISGGPATFRIRLLEEADPSTNNNNLIDDDLIQYYKFLADKGETTAQVGLGQLYVQGSKGIPVNYGEAFQYFKQASEGGSAMADAYLGRMYAEGLGDLDQDYDTAFMYFTRSAQAGSAIGQSGLGVMYLKGHAVEKDVNKAFKLFQQSADQLWVDGLLHLGLMHYSLNCTPIIYPRKVAQTVAENGEFPASLYGNSAVLVADGEGTKKDYKSALKYFNLASQSGNVLALYNLAKMHATGTGVMRACHTAVEFYKNVAERGSSADLLTDAYDFYSRGYIDVAMLKYLLTAELGFEVAQSNVAYILDNGETDAYQHNEKYRRALLQWNRAAGQGSPVARIKLGDYHYYGLGTDIDYEQAVQHYRVAGEQQNNAQAMYNLAYMHEAGLGLKQDLHLAKRFYDMAADASKDASVPVTLALTRLALLSHVEYLSNMSNIFGMVSSLHPQLYFGPSWDMYLMAMLSGVLALLYVLRTQVLAPPPPQ